MNDQAREATVAAQALSFADPEVQKCPFSAYDRLRAEAPVYLDPITGHYVVTTYKDVRKAVLNTKQLSSDNGLVSARQTAQQEEIDALYRAAADVPAKSISSYDPPEHKLHRAPLDRAFDHWNVRAIEGDIAQLADRFIDDFIDLSEVEFVSAFAAKLPMFVIAAQLGVDIARMDDFKRWSDARVAIIAPELKPEDELASAREIAHMYGYFAQQIERVRATPDASLLSKLLQVTDEEGRPLDVPELLALMENILVAGNETTAFAIAIGMKLLVEEPKLATEIRGNQERIDAFVEETLRVRSPLQVHFRRAAVDLEVAGVPIAKGAMVEVRYGAANRDPDVFECPERVDLGRPNGRAHLAFGAGAHICVGMQLARAELRIAFERLLDRLDNIRLAGSEEDVRYTPMYISHGVVGLNLAFDKRRKV